MAGEAKLSIKINGVEITADAQTVEVFHEVGNAGTAYHFDTGLTAKVYLYDGTEEVGDITVDLVHQWEVNAE